MAKWFLANKNISCSSSSLFLLIVNYINSNAGHKSVAITFIKQKYLFVLIYFIFIMLISKSCNIYLLLVHVIIHLEVVVMKYISKKISSLGTIIIANYRKDFFI